jgi:hypothetical protein
MNNPCYQCASSTKWAVEIHGIILINEKTGNVCSLGYPQAAIWDLISRGYADEQFVNMVCAITSLQTSEAQRLIVENLENWLAAGFLIPHGESLNYDRL